MLKQNAATGTTRMKSRAVPRVPKYVSTPAAQETEEHNATHIPANGWCPACVEGKCANPPHRRVECGRSVPEVGLDCAFMREADSDDKLTILVMKDRDSKAVSSDVVE